MRNTEPDTIRDHGTCDHKTVAGEPMVVRTGRI
jgi:hypothetical protein